MDAAKDRVRDQYQRSGDGYRESVIHAKGKDTGGSRKRSARPPRLSSLSTSPPEPAIPPLC